VLEVVSTFLEQLESWILAMAASAWVYPAMFGFATIDGFFPPLPSESVVITLTVTAHASGTPWLPAVLVIAALGAWCGDQIAYSIGKAVGTERIPFLRTARGRRAVVWARRALLHRGASLILAARYVPVGRVAVNMTAGAVGYPRRRFMAYAAIAASTWAVYSMLIGLAAASWLGHNTLLAMAVGVVAGILLGVVVDRVVQRLTRRKMAEAEAAELAAEEAERAAAAAADQESCPEPCTAEAGAGRKSA
jgi:membrane protein DedA with SNARE-associated domain